VGQLALAWCIKNKNVTTVLLGATKPEQLIENIGCLEVVSKITEDDMKAIEEIIGNKPEAYGGYGGSGARHLTLG
jgi:aryl-alcohol dehydrogenase-like predicted oxidoreductase